MPRAAAWGTPPSVGGVSTGDTFPTDCSVVSSALNDAPAAAAASGPPWWPGNRSRAGSGGGKAVLCPPNGACEHYAFFGGATSHSVTFGTLRETLPKKALWNPLPGRRPVDRVRHRPDGRPDRTDRTRGRDVAATRTLRRLRTPCGRARCPQRRPPLPAPVHGSPLIINTL